MSSWATHLQQTYIDLVSPAYHLWQTGVFLYEPRIDAYDKNARKTSEIKRFQTFSSSLTNFSGGDKRDRTADLLNAIQALSQLSYTPIFALLRSVRQLLYYSTAAKNVKAFFRFF